VALQSAGRKGLLRRAAHPPAKAYIVEAVADPRGFDTPETETITTIDRTDPSNPIINTVQTERITHEEKLRFSLQFAKRYGAVTFRIGVIESSGGVGADLHLFHDRLQLSTSLYEFQSEFVDYPRAKVWVDYRFLQHFFLTAGADDFLNRYQDIQSCVGRTFSIGNDVFFGAGIFFTDDDLKAFIAGGGASAVGR
jgi:phospholipid/cholesterol/gamma-HCH transport system substrate-binding protein